MLGKVIAPVIAQRSSENIDFYLQNCHILDIFWPIQAGFVAGELLCDLEIPS